MNTEEIYDKTVYVVPAVQTHCSSHDVMCAFNNLSYEKCRTICRSMVSNREMQEDGAQAYIAVEDYPTWVANRLKGKPL